MAEAPSNKLEDPETASRRLHRVEHEQAEAKLVAPQVIEAVGMPPHSLRRASCSWWAGSPFVSAIQGSKHVRTSDDFFYDLAALSKKMTVNAGCIVVGLVAQVLQGLRSQQQTSIYSSIPLTPQEKCLQY